MAKKSTPRAGSSARSKAKSRDRGGRVSLRSAERHSFVRPSSRRSEERGAKGRDQVDLHADINLGVFGFLRPDQFTGPLRPEQATDAISIILKDFTFPSLNVIFAASARLREKDKNDLKVDATLDEMEARISLTPLDDKGDVVTDPNLLQILGLYPFDTTTEQVDPKFQVTPNISSLLTAIPGIPAALTGIVSALGLSFGGLFSPSFPIVDKAFLASRTEFGWYLKSVADKQKEGVHYGVAFLQVARTVSKLKVAVSLGSDWKGGDVDNQSEPRFEKILLLKHPEPPTTPQLSDFTSASSLPLVIPAHDVRKLLNIEDAELVRLASEGKIVMFGSGDKRVITKGSLLTLLGVDQRA